MFMTKSYFEQKYRILPHCAILVERDGTKITRDRLNSSGILASILYYFRFVSFYRDGKEVEMFRLKSKSVGQTCSLFYSQINNLEILVDKCNINLIVTVVTQLILLYCYYSSFYY